MLRALPPRPLLSRPILTAAIAPLGTWVRWGGGRGSAGRRFRTPQAPAIQRRAPQGAARATPPTANAAARAASRPTAARSLPGSYVVGAPRRVRGEPLDRGPYVPLFRAQPALERGLADAGAGCQALLAAGAQEALDVGPVRERGLHRGQFRPVVDGGRRLIGREAQGGRDRRGEPGGHG